MSNYPAVSSDRSSFAVCSSNLLRRWAIFIATLIACGLLGAPTVRASLPATTTVLTVTAGAVPTSSVASGTVVTLTATVSTPGPVTAGTVRFCDASPCINGALIGTAQLTSAGTATIKFVPAIGSYNYYAIFNGTNSFPGSNSLSALQPLSVTGTYPTTTAISHSGVAGNYTLTGTVVGSGSISLSPTGSVSFIDTTNGNFPLGSQTLGSSTFAHGLAAAVPYASGLAPSAVAVGDFNNDGIPDLAVVNQTAGTVSVLLGNPDGTFQSQANYTVGNTPVAVAVGDLRGVGIQDLVVVNSLGNTVSVLLGVGNGTFGLASSVVTGSGPIALAIGDFNNDGILDLAVVDNTTGKVGILVGNGLGGFAAEVPYTVGTNPVALVAGDFNGDGVLDLVVANKTDGTVSVLLGVGDGTFGGQIAYAANANPTALAAADLNADGKLDLVVANSSANTVSVLLNVASGTFPTAATYSTGNNPVAVTVGDFDGDGNEDVAVISRADNTVSLLLGSPTGALQAQTPFSTGTTPVALIAADFNGDGHPDLAVVNSAAAGISVLLDSLTQTATASVSGVSIPGTGSAHLIEASYPGNTNFSLSTSPTTSLTSTAITTALALGAVPASSTYGGTVTLTATLSPATDGALSTDGDVVTFKSGGVSVGTGTLSGGVATLVLTTLPAGIDSLTAVFPGDANFGTSSSVAANFTVTKAVLTVTAQDATRVYGAANPGFTAAYSGFVNGDTQITATTGAPNLTTTAIASSSVTTYPITAAVGTLASTNYSFTFVAGTLTVTKAVLTVTAQDATKVYAAALPTLTSLTTGFLNGDTLATAATGAPSLTTTALATSPVATYPITAAVGTLASTNYSFVFVNGTLTVTKAVLTVTAQDATKVYGAANPAFAALITGFVNGDTQGTATAGAPGLSSTATAASGVSTYPIVAAVGTLTATNYSFTFVNGTLTVTKAVLTVTAQNATKVYGAANPTLTAAFAGFVNGDTVGTATTGAPSLTTTATAASPVTTYPITAAVGTLASTNYSFTFVNGTLTVTQAVLTVTAQNLSRIYGAVNPTLTSTMTGFVNGDTQATATTGAASLTTTAIATSPATTYPITAAVGTLASTNYSFTFLAGTLTVTKAVLTVTAQDATRAYGAANPVFSSTMTGFVNGDTQGTATTGLPSLTTTAIASSPATTYPITAAVGTLTSTNYSFTFVNGTLTVTKVAVVVTAQNATRAYGAANPAFTATYAGFVNGDTQATATTGAPSLTSAATVSSAVNTYPIVATAGTLASTNYTFTFVNGTLTVTQAVLTVTAQNATRAYGATNPAFTATYSGFVNGDTQATATTGAPVLTTAAIATSPATTYPITAAVGTLASTNYSFTFVAGTLTVTKAVLTVTAQDATKVYGAANPAFTAVFTGFVNGDTQGTATTGLPGLTTTATATSAAGTYPITAAAGTLVSTNYSFIFVNGTLTVSKVVLTVTAQDATRAFGLANPTFTAVITGFVNGDTTATATTGSAGLTTTATTVSPVTTYPIVAAVGTLASTSYSFTFVNGTLTVTVATPTITWATPAAITYGTALSATQLNATASTPGTFVYAPPATTVLNAGSQSLMVTFTPTDGADFTGATKTVLITVNKATPVITWATPAAVPSATALTITQLDATASVAGAFVYTPALGAVPPDGLDTLSTTFTPTDTANYTTATANVVLTVGAVFNLSITGTGSDEIGGHGVAIYRFEITPASMAATLPGAVTFSVTGLPPGATAKFSPTMIAAGSRATFVDLAIRPGSNNVGSLHLPAGSSAMTALGMLLFPILGLLFVSKAQRRIPRRLAVVLLALVSLGTAIGLASCAGTTGPSTATTYPLVLTATSGNLQHSVNLTLIVHE